MKLPAPNGSHSRRNASRGDADECTGTVAEGNNIGTAGDHDVVGGRDGIGGGEVLTKRAVPSPMDAIA